MTGPLEETNKAYALAKIAGIEMCAAYNQQYGTQYLCVMPTNLYGIGDNYDLNSSHVMPALLRKAHLAKTMGSPTMTAWGSGAPRREFLMSDDLAEACLLLNRTDWARLSAIVQSARIPLINVGSGHDITIKELTELVVKVVGFTGGIEWGRSKPDGTPQKLLDISRIRELGWAPSVSLEEGIAMIYRQLARSGWGVDLRRVWRACRKSSRATRRPSGTRLGGTGHIGPPSPANITLKQACAYNKRRVGKAQRAHADVRWWPRCALPP